MENKNELGREFGKWLGVEIRAWVPICVLFVSLVSFFVYQDANIRGMEADAQVLRRQVDDLTNTLTDLRSTVARIDERTQIIQSDINFIKQRIK